MNRLTRPTVNVDETAAQYMGKGLNMETMNDRLLELILNGPTLMAVPKDHLRHIIRQLYGRLKEYEDRDAVDVYTEEDVRAAYTDGYSTGMAQGLEKAVVHGRWELYPSDFYRRCSVCKVEFDKPRFNVRAKYCPNCGARMEGDG